MTIYKADARISDNSPGATSGTFKLTILSVNYVAGSVAYLVVDNINPDILASVLQTDIISAVKTYWSLGALDLVRVL